MVDLSRIVKIFDSQGLSGGEIRTALDKSLAPAITTTPGASLISAANQIDFVVKPVQTGAGPAEFRQSMAPHPLVHQELPHDPYFGIYNRRLRSLDFNSQLLIQLHPELSGG